MTDEHLRSLQRRFRETGAEADELAYLRELERAGGHGDLELAARFGSVAAALALGLEPAGAPRTFAASEVPAFAAQFRGSWEAALVYFRVALDGVCSAWRARGSQYSDTLQELRPMDEAVGAWFDGHRSGEASLLALAWVNSTAARVELIDGRFPPEGRAPDARALSHLTYALGGLAYVCTPLWAPFHSGGRRELPRRDDGSPIGEDEVRLQRVYGVQFELREAIKGLMYSDHPQLNMLDQDYGERVDAALRPFETLAAEGLVRWLLKHDRR